MTASDALYALIAVVVSVVALVSIVFAFKAYADGYDNLKELWVKADGTDKVWLCFLLVVVMAMVVLIIANIWGLILWVVS